MTSRPLTAEQEDVVNLASGAWLVTALPGCGKTEVLAARVEHLLRVSGRRRSRVLVLTFTTRAAEAVNERVRLTVPEHSDRVVAQTFHQFAAEVLRQQASNRHRDLYSDRAERLLALRNALAGEGLLGTGHDLDQLLNRIELAKKTLAFEGGAPLAPDLQPAFDAYRSYQEREGVCDFDDLILDVIALFRSPTGPVSVYRQLYGSVLVDEAQDLNRSQYELVRALVGPGSDVMFMADDRQSIFAFNGADVGLLERFEREFAAGRRRLTMSFRCGRRIVAAANTIAKGLNRVSQDEFREEGALAEGAVEIAEFADELTEASAVATRVQRLLTDGLERAACHPGERLTVEPHEIAVLARSRFALSAVEDVLRAQLPHVVVSYDRDDAVSSSTGRAVVWLLRAVAHPSDLVVREQLVAAAAKLTDTPDSHEGALTAIVAAGDSHLAEIAQSALGADADLKLVGTALSVLEVVPRADDDEAVAWASDVTWLGRIRTVLRRKLGRDPTPSEFVRELAMPTTTNTTHAPGVRILTVHAAKGQEFRAVILVGMAEGTFPSYRATTLAALDEERRLAYVAITRASRLLLATRPRSRKTATGTARVTNVSRFFSELTASQTH